MNEYFQIWTNVPYAGRQFVGWLWTTKHHAIGLLTALNTSSATSMGIGFEMLTQAGQPIVPAGTGWPTVPGLPDLGGFGIPGLGA